MPSQFVWIIDACCTKLVLSDIVHAHRGCKTKRVATAGAKIATVHWAVRLLTAAADEKGLVCATGADVYEKAIGR